MASNNETPQAAETQQAAAPSNPEAQAPIVRAIQWLQDKYNGLCNGVLNLGEKTDNFAQSTLRTEKSEAEETTMLKTMPYTVGHVLDAAFLTDRRREYEVLRPAFDGLRALHRGTVGTIMNPSRILTAEFWKTPVRLLTSGVQMVKNILRIPDRTLDDIVDIGIKKPLQQINFKTEKIPGIGPIIAKATNLIGKGGAYITNNIRAGLDWLTSPIDDAHDAVAPS